MAAPFSFLPIHASDLENYSVAQASQCNVMLSHVRHEIQEAAEDLQARLEELARSSQDREPLPDINDIEATIERNLEMKMANSYTSQNIENLNRMTRLEMRTEQISATGDMVVDKLAVWIDRAQMLFLQFDEQALRHQEELEKQSLKHKEDLERMSGALNDLFQQTRAHFQHVDDSQQILHARDLDILRSDLQTHVSQTRSQDGAAIQAQMQSLQSGLIARLDAMALAAASSQHDPWFRPTTVDQGAAAPEGIPCAAANPYVQWVSSGVKVFRPSA